MRYMFALSFLSKSSCAAKQHKAVDLKEKFELADRITGIRKENAVF